MPVAHGRLRVRGWHIRPSLVAVLVLGAALLALGTWAIVDRTTSSPTTGLASPEVVTMLSDRVAALNSGNAQAISAFYARDAVVEERDLVPATVTRGRDQIGERIARLVRNAAAVGDPMQLEPAGPVVQLGRTVAQAANVQGLPDQGYILVYLLDARGKIRYQWVLPAG